MPRPPAPLQPLLWLALPGARRQRGLARLRAWRARRALRPRLAALRSAGSETVVLAMLEHMGDVAAAEPAIREARRRHHDAHLAFAVKPAWRPLVDHHPDLDEVIPLACLGDWVYLVAGELFDHVYDLQTRGRWCDRTGLLLKRQDVDTSIDITNYYRHGPLLHAAVASGGLCPGGVGELGVDPAPRLHLPPGAIADADELALPDALAVIHPRSNQLARDWNDAGWHSLASWLRRERGLAVAIIGMPAPDGLTAEGCIDLRGRCSLATTAEVIRRARLFVGIDSGPAHLANAAGTPGVVVLGHYGRYERYMPFAGGYADGSSGTVLHHDGPASATPAGRVIAAAEAWLEGHPPRARGAVEV